MVIKGGSRSGGAGLAAHLLRTDTNERAEVLELHGVLADRLPEALHEMEAVASGTRCQKALYHASINTGPGEELTLEQKAAAVARLELALGLEGHARAVVEHRKEGRDHLHVVWSRIDVDTMRAAHDGHNFRKHEAVARELEREFGHNRVQGAHVERDGPAGERRPRPPRTPSPGDVQQATRTKRDLGAAAVELTRLWRAADTGPAFAAALDGAGYVLAQGDRRGYCVIDQAGAVHSLARRIEGARTRDVNARLAGIELAGLPTVDQARAMQRDRALPARERPGGGLAGELVRPAAERVERSDDRARQEARDDASRQEIRADFDRHLRDQAEKPPAAPQTARGEAERPAAPETPVPRRDRAYTPAEEPGGPDLKQQVADSAEYRRERAASTRANDNRPAKPAAAKEAGRALGRGASLLGSGLGKAAGGLLSLLGGLLGGAAGTMEQATRSQPTKPQPTRDAPAAPAARPEPRQASRPAPLPENRPQPPPAPRPPSVFDEIQAKIREREAQGGKPAPAPSPEKNRDRDHDRSRFQARPIVRLVTALGEDTGWVVEAKKRLIAYSNRTGKAVGVQLAILNAILFRTWYDRPA